MATENPKADRFNGWANHATWCVNLHLSNDDAIASLARGTAQAAAIEARGCSQVRDRIWSQNQAQRFILADALRDWLKHETVKTLGDIGTDPWKCLASDLLLGYLEDVDWNELAVHWLDDPEEPLKNTEEE